MKKILILLFLLVSPILSATNYYVATTAGGGNDANPGTIGSPWRTINRAVNASGLVAGDIVYVRGGTYNERATVYLINGSSGSPIIIQNYPAESPIIDGTGITISPGGSLFQIYGNYIHLIGFHIHNGDSGPAAGIITTGHHTLISHCVIHDMQQNAIIMMGGDYSIVEYVTAYNLCLSNSDGYYDRAGGEVWGTGISMTVEANYCIIRHCLIHDVWGEGYSAYEVANATIEDNILYNHYSVGFYVSDAIDCLVQRNLVYNTQIIGDYHQAGFGHWNEGQPPYYANARNTFINNIAYGCPLSFVSLTCDNLTVLNNTFVNATINSGVRLQGPYTNSVFKNNIVVQENGLPVFTDIGTHTGLTFSNNLYNKSYDADAVGTGDVVSTLHISKVGTYADTSYYALLSTSPAINGGTDVNVDYDYLSVARGVTFDIGALEYVAPGTPIGPIVINVTSVYSSTTYATIQCNVTDDGGASITARGVCWSTSANPTTADSKTTNGTGTGAFTATLTPLLPSTTYYMRAYATNSAGTTYDDDGISFITSSTGQKRNVVYSGS